MGEWEPPPLSPCTAPESPLPEVGGDLEHLGLGCAEMPGHQCGRAVMSGSRAVGRGRGQGVGGKFLPGYIPHSRHQHFPGHTGLKPHRGLPLFCVLSGTEAGSQSDRDRDIKGVVNPARTQSLNGYRPGTH